MASCKTKSLCVPAHQTTAGCCNAASLCVCCGRVGVVVTCWWLGSARRWAWAWWHALLHLLLHHGPTRYGKVEVLRLLLLLRATTHLPVLAHAWLWRPRERLLLLLLLWLQAWPHVLHV